MHLHNVRADVFNMNGSGSSGRDRHPLRQASPSPMIPRKSKSGGARILPFLQRYVIGTADWLPDVLPQRT